MVGRSLRVGGTLRRLLVLASSALLIGMLVGSNASTAATPPHTRQSIAQHILKTRAAKIATASARLALEATARGERTEAALRRDTSLKANKPAGGEGENNDRGLANVRVNDPSADGHQVDQTTQSETTIAVSGTKVVVGFNDSQQSLQPFLTAGSNLTAYAYSSNGGSTWTDGGTIPNRQSFINLGDPWLGADRAGNFYYSTLTIDGFTGNLHVGVAKSTNGGATFSVPVIASPTDGFFYFGDKDALAVGPDPVTKSRDNIYIAWDDMACDAVSCFNGLPVARSTDGGASYQITYADKFVASDTSCSFVQYIGAMPLVDARNGTLYVAAERFNVNDPLCDGTGTVTIDESIFKSTDGGQTFGSRVQIATINPAFDFGYMELGPGLIVRTIEFPVLALLGNNLFAAWNEGSSGHSHIRLAKSTNGGGTWTSSWATNGSNDEIQPALSSDGAGLHLLYYRRNSNNTLDTVVRNSSNGSNFSSRTVTTTSFPGVLTLPQFDPVIAFGYMGDYIANVSDGSRQYFAWGDNRDRVTNFLWPQGRNDPNVYFARQ
ncbi:MAG: glycoside hydrolase [Chloroflexota bacterium]|nr:glycoside hydrolase [Chloroflexota bacterium]